MTLQHFILYSVCLFLDQKLLSSCLLCLFDFEERTRKSWVDAEMTLLDLETLMREHL